MTRTCPHCGKRDATHAAVDVVDGVIRPTCDVCDPPAVPEPLARRPLGISRDVVLAALAAGHDTQTAICAHLGIDKKDHPRRHGVSTTLQDAYRAGQVTQEPINPARPHFKRWQLVAQRRAA